jgi:hypothetical protein
MSQPSQVPQSGQNVRLTKVGPMNLLDDDAWKPKPDEVWTDLKAIGRQKKEERMRKRHRRR